MSINDSFINIIQALREGTHLTKGMKVKLPLDKEGSIYGFVPTDPDIFCMNSNKPLDTPISGVVKIVGNRCLCMVGNLLCRFPIFYSISLVDEERYPLSYLYIPRLLNREDCPSQVHAYRFAMMAREDKQEFSYLEKIPGVKVENKEAFYYPQNGDFLFKSSSLLKGLADSFSIITWRVSQSNDEIMYEVYNPDDILIDKSDAKV